MEKEGYMRINTLSNLLNVKPSLRDKMVQKLSASGLLITGKYSIIFLTEAGKNTADSCP